MMREQFGRSGSASADSSPSRICSQPTKDIVNPSANSKIVFVSVSIIFKSLQVEAAHP
jgi:hypothetical protein